MIIKQENKFLQYIGVVSILLQLQQNLKTMQTRITRAALRLLPYGLPLAMIALLVILASTELAKANPIFFKGLTIDLLILIPLIHFLLIRKKKTPKITVLSFIVIGTIVGSFIIPKEFKGTFTQITGLLIPIIELIVFGTIIYFMRKGIIAARKNGATLRDRYLLIQKASIEALGIPKLAKALASEFALFYYALFSWKIYKRTKTEFSNHKRSGVVAILVVLIMVTFAETTAVHLLLESWSPLAAWILTIGSIYTAIFLIGHGKAIVKRPHHLQEQQLVLKNGLIATVFIPYGQIENIHLVEEKLDQKETPHYHLATLGEMESYNLRIDLKEELEVQLIYGIKKKAKTIVFQVDEEDTFLEQFKRFN